MAPALPIVDLSVLSSPSPLPYQLAQLSQDLYNVFSTTGFAYLVNSPMSFTHSQIFSMASDFFTLPKETKMSLAKRSFVKENNNTYRGYFPPQPSYQNNLKEGFEIGPASTSWTHSPTGNKAQQRLNLSEPNVWPPRPDLRSNLEQLHAELQSLSMTLLSLLATSLDKPSTYFDHYTTNSLSTLRLLHYPRQHHHTPPSEKVELCCTPHTDSGLLTLLTQDPTGGLEVFSPPQQKWIKVEYLPESLIVNIGDLMAEISNGEFVATLHRVTTCRSKGEEGGGLGRLSVPFFFEPGEDDVIGARVYGEHVREKMGGVG